MSTRNELARMTIDIPKVNHKKLKALAAVLGTSMRDLVLDAIEDFVERKKPAGKLKQTIKEIEAGKGLVEVDDVEALFKKWNE